MINNRKKWKRKKQNKKTRKTRGINRWFLTQEINISFLLVFFFFLICNVWSVVPYNELCSSLIDKAGILDLRFKRRYQGWKGWYSKMLSVRNSIVTIGVEMMGIDRHLDWQRCSLSGLSYYKLNKVGFEISFYSPFQAKPSTKSRLLNSSILIISLQFCLQLKFIFMKNDFSCKLFIWYKMHFTILKFIFHELYSYFDERKFDAHFNLVRLYNNCKGKIYTCRMSLHFWWFAIRSVLQ